MFYYGDTCKRQIARTALLNPDFLQYKQRFYANSAKLAQPNINIDANNIKDVSNNVNTYLYKNEEFNEETVQEIQDMTNVLNLISTKYLGNIQHFLGTSSQETSNSVAQALQDIPTMIKYVQNKLNDAIVEPTSAMFISPLQKLYKALSKMDTSTKMDTS
jgi:gas vesicle protein